jgi:nucleotide-binding universal stress UspA family protein
MAIKTILVPTDFSQASDSALLYAKEVADTCGAALRILHVLDIPVLPYGYAEIYPPPPQEYFDQLEHSARQRLDATMSSAEREKYRAELLLLRGHPGAVILDYLEHAPDIDLVILATHGRGAMGKLMMGSVADKVIRRAPCAVLTLREDALERAAIRQVA